MAGFHTAAMPRPQTRARPAAPIVDIALVRPPQLVAVEDKAPVKTSPYGRRMSAEQKALVRQRVAEGHSLEAAAAEVGFGITAAKRAGRGLSGTAAAAMLSAREEDRRAKQAEVRLLLEKKIPVREIARRLKLSEEYVGKLRLSDKDYARYLAGMRKRSRLRNARRKRAKRGLRANFLVPLAKAVKLGSGVGLAEMKTEADGQPRHPDFVRARQVLCWLAVAHRGFPPTRVGTELGIDHTTVLHAVAVVQAVADATDFPTRWRPLHPVVAILMDAMQRDAAKRRQDRKACRPEIPTP
ncbi:hypothetical protein NS228_06010 [Methylobacterium indicum]|uniref:hypothetical protein n=1 Tax=Methylobacterium indicum TaxID=1775910 RepID=UPI000733D1A3|nr:hypothetical protein [Methylobacterium indicum]KTS30894.1 hypothetical protein NS229_14825 [Methylobacterium indicum]KTS41519.1 hypothetical protein NS228_06010 [Methylobacterium indicum]KTS52427.1 hypothetical protein NS230_09905 [Methylobacterium indicum]